MMEITLSRPQVVTLLKAIYLGDWVVNAIRGPGEYVSEFEELEQYLLALAHRSGFQDMIEFNSVLSQFHLRDEYGEQELQPFIDEYDDETFWDGLVDRLAGREFSETYGDSAAGMDQNERFARHSRLMENYEAEIQEHGIDRLRIIAE